MKYMTIPAYNPYHGYALLDRGVCIKKTLLIKNVIRKSRDYQQWEADELRKSEQEFEKVFYGEQMEQK